MTYLFAAYLVLWGITFAYVLSINARHKRLQRELERLAQRGAGAQTTAGE